MMKNLKWIAALTFAGTVLFAILYIKTAWGVMISLAITTGTVTYHIGMRLLVGFAFRSVMRNKADYQRRRYRVGKFEMSVYEKLKVKKWKRAMPTYDRTLFDRRVHTWDEIAKATCQAERIHETIVVLSFLPILEGIRFGAYPVFITTSVLAAAFDTLFVIIQRYNRQRILALLNGRKAR